MSHLLKALKSLETRGAAFAQSPALPGVGGEREDAGGIAVLTAEDGIEPAPSEPAAVATAERPVRIKPRPTSRVKPRRTAAPQAEPPAPPRPLMTTLARASRLPVAKKLEDAPPPTAAEEAQAQQYSLAPETAVNQVALDAGAALARELEAGNELATEPVPKSEEAHASKAKTPPARTATLFEHRLRETLLHPARSRPFAELVQRLRQDFRGSQERSLLFTGIGQASRGDEMLAHVAALFAEEGERVLLVDADFERAGLTASFAAGTFGGLQNALATPRTWQDHLVPTSFENLSFLPIGRGNLSTATASDALTSLIPKLEGQFPLVLIDGGRSSGTLLTPLARSCDATYFVIRLGATDAKEAQAALKTFRAAGARVMGCVAVMAND